MKPANKHTLIVTVALVAVLVCLIWAAASKGATVIVAPAAGTGLPYQAWVNEAQVPTPDVTLTIVEDSSGCQGQGSACTVEGGQTIWIDPTPFEGVGVSEDDVHETLLHEVGHQAGYRMPPWVLARFEAMRGDPRPWRQAPNAPIEQFAEAWRLCAEGARGRVEGGYKYRAGAAMQGRVCRLLRRY